MNKKIKAIELLNIINENKNIPKKIKYNDIEYKYDEDMQEYYACKEGRTTYFFYNVVEHKWAWLDTEVEILEDEEEIEEIEVDDNNYIVTDNRTNLKGRAIDITFVNKINEIIKKVNELDKKINKED